MVVKVYISGISGNKEVKKRQQRVLMILDSKSIKYEVIDITEPGREADKDCMQNNSKANGATVSDPNPRSPLPPQIFNDDEYCGDYDQFDMANEVDTLEQFLGLEVPPDSSQSENGQVDNHSNGDVSGKKAASKESSQERNGVNEKASSKEASPAITEETTAKESSPALDTEIPKETKESSVERTEVADESKKSSKEPTPVKDETATNGSSRAESLEKGSGDVVKEIKEVTPSEALIESEQTAAVE